MFVKKNYNPKKENIGDCLIRAFVAFHRGTKTYEQIKNELKVIGKKVGCTYNSDRAIIHYCKNNNLKAYVSNDKRDEYVYKLSKKYNLDNKTVFQTKNKRMNINNFTKYNEGDAIVCTRDHAVYIDNNNYIDTWDSGRCFVNYVIRK